MADRQQREELVVWARQRERLAVSGRNGRADESLFLLLWE
jgi:hypothetical protein